METTKWLPRRERRFEFEIAVFIGVSFFVSVGSDFAAKRNNPAN
jgi:hypothetical protein